MRSWEINKHSNASYVVCKLDKSSNEELKIEARIYDALFQHRCTDYWIINDFFAVINSPYEHTINTIEVVGDEWRQFLLKQLKKRNPKSEYNPTSYLDTLNHIALYSFLYGSTETYPESYYD